MTQIEAVKDYLGRGVIRKLAGSQNYFMRFRIFSQKGWTKWRTTKTPILQDAQRVASKEYERLKEQVLHADAKSLNLQEVHNDLTFVGVANKWLEYYRLRAEAGIVTGNGRKPSLKQYKDYKKFVEKYLTEFFGDELDKINVDRVKAEHITSYILWRKTYWTEGPGKDIKQIEVQRGDSSYMKPVVHKEVELSSGELVVLRSIFNYALAEGFISVKQVPVFPSNHKSIKQVKADRYPAFSKTHWEIVENKIDEYIAVLPAPVFSKHALD